MADAPVVEYRDDFFGEGACMLMRESSRAEGVPRRSESELTAPLEQSERRGVFPKYGLRLDGYENEALGSVEHEDDATRRSTDVPDVHRVEEERGGEVMAP